MAKAASWRGASARALLALAGTVAVSSCVGNIGPTRETPPGSRRGLRDRERRYRRSDRQRRARPRHRRRRFARGRGRRRPSPAQAARGTVLQCNSIAPGRSPMRRLTTYEYNNTIRDLLGDTTNPGSALPAQVDSKQNPFGNDADEQSPTDVLVEKYQAVAESIATRATANATALGKLHSCATNVTAANEEAAPA